ERKRDCAPRSYEEPEERKRRPVAGAHAMRILGRHRAETFVDVAETDTDHSRPDRGDVVWLAAREQHQQEGEDRRQYHEAQPALLTPRGRPGVTASRPQHAQRGSPGHEEDRACHEELLADE